MLIKPIQEDKGHFFKLSRAIIWELLIRIDDDDLHDYVMGLLVNAKDERDALVNRIRELEEMLEIETMPNKRKFISNKELFLQDITRLINNLLIANKNYNNGYYANKSCWDVINDTQERANYILERMNDIKHLVLDEC